MSEKSVRDGEDHWVHPLKEENKERHPCPDCGGEMGHIGDLKMPSDSTPTTQNRVATLECMDCGSRVKNATLGGF